MFWLLLCVLILFVVFGMDIRKKKGMTPITNKQYVIGMKVSCLILLLLYLNSLFNINETGLVEWAAFFLTATGTLFVAVAKLRLSDSFSWTGHFLKDTKLITGGIYQYVRNPLYTGVFLFEAGAVTNFIFNSVVVSEYPLPLLIAGGITLSYAVAFNVIMARKEADKLEQQFGDEYRRYKQNTGAFFPKLSVITGGHKNVTS